MEEDTKRSLIINYGLGLLMVVVAALIGHFDGGFWWWISGAALAGLILVFHGHFPNVLSVRRLLIVGGVLLAIALLVGSGWILGLKQRADSSTKATEPQKPLAKASAPVGNPPLANPTNENTSPVRTAVDAGIKRAGTPASVIQNNIQGINIGPGATAPNATVVNNGPPPPKVSEWHVEPNKADPLTAVDVHLMVDRTVDIPAFIAECDRPCHALFAIVADLGMVYDDEARPLAIGGKPNLAVVLLNTARVTVGYGHEIIWGIGTDNGGAPKITNVYLMAEEEARKIPPRPR